MPNQYTKFQAASEDPTTRAFTWREWTGKKQKRARVAKKKRTTEKKDSPADDSTSSNADTSPTCTPSSSSLILYLPSGGYRIDPFRSYPVAPDHEEMAVLDHYLYILAPSGKLNEVVARPRDAYIDPHINLLLPYVMQDSALFDAMLAGCQASISMSSGLSAYKDEFFAVHRGRAMAGLRQKLANGPDTSTFVIITLLITCDYLLGDIQAVAEHTRALQRMQDLVGQLPSRTRWDRFVKTGVEAYKLIGLFATGIPEQGRSDPLDDLVDPFKDLEYPDQPLSPVVCEQWTNLAPGFLDLMFASQLSTQLCTIIAGFDQLATASPPSGVSNLRILNPIQAALQRFSQHKQATYLERCVAAGLTAYSFQFPRVQIPNMFHDPPLQGMLRLFSVNYRSSSKLEREALIWAVIVAMGIMSMRMSPLPKSKEVFTRFIERQPLMRCWSSVEKVVRRFLWTPSLLKRWKACYEAMVKGSAEDDTSTANSSPFEDFLDLSNDDDNQPTMVCPVTGRLPDTTYTGAGICPFFPTSSPGFV